MRLVRSAGLMGLLLGGALPAAAQSLHLTNATLQFWEQDGGFLTSAGQRLYTYHFDATSSRYVGGLVTLTYDAVAAATSATISCTITLPDARTIDGMFRMAVRIPAGSSTATGENLLVGSGSNSTWAPGVYTVRCGFVGGSPFVEGKFAMTASLPVVAGADVRVQGLQFFPTGPRTMAEASRKYTDRFEKDQATRIGVEVRFVHPALGKKVSVPVDCYYLAPNRVWFGPMSFSYETDPAATTGTGALGIGYDEPGHWDEGDYLALCQINGRPVATGWFKVW
jgi:hypothetical protein